MLFVTLLVTSPGGKMSYSLKEGADSLEEVFFIKQDQKLIEKLRELKRMEESKEALAQVSGITDDKVLGELVKLEIRPEILAALALIPLVEIAWVDGKLDDKEREAILDSTKKTGLLGGDIDRAILEEWFNHRPDRKLLEAVGRRPGRHSKDRNSRSCSSGRGGFRRPSWLGPENIG
jgi:hypothetical protein